ncbi:hypothetical protein BH09PSE2_BH09PSE2_17680 [soil metagenome]
MSAALFQRLKDKVAAADDAVSHASAIRYIKRLDDFDAELMANAKSESLVLTRQIRLVRISYEDITYFVAFGLPEPETLPLGLQVADNTPGIFAVAVLSANIQPGRLVTVSGIKDVLGGQSAETEGYVGHDLEEIRPLFPEMVVYLVHEEFPYQRSAERVLGSLLSKTYSDGPISLETDTVAALVEIFEQGSEFLPFQNLLQGVLSISWENLYVEIYRCVEQLYSLPRLSKLKKEIAYANSPRELALIIENQLSWRPKEEEAFRALVQMCDHGTVSSLCLGLSNGQGETHERRSEVAVAELYDLRNQIVHYRPSHERIIKSDERWNIIVRSMLAITSHLYLSEGEAFFGKSGMPPLNVVAKA